MTFAEQTKYDTLSVMAIDMHKNGYTLEQIAGRLEIGKLEVCEMLKRGSVADVNRKIGG